MQKHLLLFLLLIGGIKHSIAQSHLMYLFPSNRVEKTITLSNNIKLNYVEQGNRLGVPVIFLHGYTDSWHSFEQVLPYLPENIHAFAISQRGHGNSDRVQTDFAPQHFADDVASFIEQLNLGPVIIVGHSMGGVIAQRIAIDYPSLTKALVIISSAAKFDDNPAVREFNDIVQQLNSPVDSAFAAEFQAATIVRPVSSRYFNTVVAESRKVPVHVWKAALYELLNADLLPELKKIVAPTMVVWGDRDSFCDRKAQDRIVQSIKGAKLLIYEGTGHALHWEQPQRFAKDLVEFVQNNK